MQKVIDRYLNKMRGAKKGLSDFSVVPSEFTPIMSYFEDLLFEAYMDGYEEVGYMLNDVIDRTPDSSGIYEVMYMDIGGEDITDRVLKYVIALDDEGLRRLMDSEFHRLYCAGAHQRATEVDNVKKTWVTVNDKQVRDTHSYLEGMTVDLDEDFYTFDDDHAPAPGMFTKAENNVNCRCIIKYSIL